MSYAFDQSWQRERARLAALQDMLDAVTRDHLRRTGLARGWRCLEVGAGAGGVVDWLADQVGPTGYVLATDLDPRFLDAGGWANVEVRRHDIAGTEPLGAGFDLAHARLVLEHVPAREAALQRMIAAVRPGGWVVIEDADSTEETLPLLVRYSRPVEYAHLHERIWRAIIGMLRSAGSDPDYGARLPDVLSAAGLREIGVSMRVATVAGRDEPGFFRLSVEHLGPAAVRAGQLTQLELDQFLLATEKDDFVGAFAVTTAWGRRPSG